MKDNIFQSVFLEDLDNWPTVLEQNLSEKKLALYNSRKNAIYDYVNGIAIEELCEKNSLSKPNFYRIFRRCLETHPDGRINGFRGLLPYKRIEKSRETPFVKLLNDYPQLEEQLIKDYLNIGTKKSVQEKNMSFKTIHQRFLKNCLKLGISIDSYPFTNQSKASKSVRRFLATLEQSHFNKVAQRHGDEAGMLAKNSGVPVESLQSEISVKRPFERVEFDGHKIDVSLAITYTTPEGDQITDAINRIWILTIIDVSTRCILGYHISLSKEYNSDDVLMTIRNAVLPWKPKNLTIPNLKYSEGAAMPSYAIEEAQYAIWDEFCYDNAKANIAKSVQETLINVIGCSINMGPVATPIRRPHIERFFKTLETNGFQRMVSTTGNNLKDPRRNKQSEKTAVKYQITPQHIEEITDVLIADYNNSPHDSLYGLTPLEAMAQRINKGIFINKIAEQNRKDIAFFTMKVKRKVNGDIKFGRRPSITFEGVKYTSDILANSPHLIGKTLTLAVNLDDLRVIRVFLENGEELGVLSAKGNWAIQPHSLRERKAINKLKHDKKLSISSEEDPIEVYHMFLKQNATTKNDRNKLASFEKNKTSKQERYNVSNEVKSNSSVKKNEPVDVNTPKLEKPINKLRKTLQF